MAIPFNLPKSDNHQAGGQQNLNHHHHQTTALTPSSSQSSSAVSSINSSPILPISSSSTSSQTTNSGSDVLPHIPLPLPHTPHTPLIMRSPGPNEHLVQAFCEALHRCSLTSNGQAHQNTVGAGGGMVGFQYPPQSPSCVSSHMASSNIQTPQTPYSASSAYSSQNSNVFFPQNGVPPLHYVYPQQPPTPHNFHPQTHHHPGLHQQQQGSPLYFQYHPQPQYQPSYQTHLEEAQQYQNNVNNNTSQSPAAISHHHVPRKVARRLTMPSLENNMDQETITNHHHETQRSHSLDMNNNPSMQGWNEHFYFLEAREQLEEFPGRVPQRRKKSKKSPATESNSEVITSQKQQNREERPQPPTVINNKISANPDESDQREPNRGTNSDTKEQCLNWSLVTAFVLVVGCGFYASSR